MTGPLPAWIQTLAAQHFTLEGKNLFTSYNIHTCFAVITSNDHQFLTQTLSQMLLGLLNHNIPLKVSRGSRQNVFTNWQCGDGHILTAHLQNRQSNDVEIKIFMWENPRETTNALLALFDQYSLVPSRSSLLIYFVCKAGVDRRGWFLLTSSFNDPKIY